ncbi:hypothetical protein LUW76_24555 [Actinomadura madurae]|uniref:DUF6879 family protein n=1 Tax=Actinomadura madurae TaxID=1993 RepID=UPI002025CAEB|nr:DUF6879 family protein [Actinomadura madurae]URM97270.1 hypothetical protein LUW76_24555 [Actinomadura madurae]
MEKLPVPTDDVFAELFASAAGGLAHLELRDLYAVDYEDERWRWWVDNGRPDRMPREIHPWWDLTATTARRVTMRRARVYSVPASDYIRFEAAGAWQNVDAGEAVRWVSRDLVSDLCLPGNDCWLVDQTRVMFNLFDGQGRPTGVQVTEDPAVVRRCVEAFEAVWERGIDHDDMRFA